LGKTGCVRDPAHGAKHIFAKKQQAPSAGQDTVRLLYKEHLDATPITVRKMMAQQLDEALEGSFLPYLCDGLIFTPCTASYVLGMDILLCKWQPQQYMAIDIQFDEDRRVTNPSIDHRQAQDIRRLERVRDLGGDVDLHGAPDVCGVTLECLPKDIFNMTKVAVGHRRIEQSGHHGKTAASFVEKAEVKVSWQPWSVRWDKARGNGNDALRALFSWHQQYKAAQTMIFDMQAQIPAIVKPSISTHPARLMPFAEIYSQAIEAVEGGRVEKWVDSAGSGIEIFNYITSENSEARWHPRTNRRRAYMSGTCFASQD